MLTLGDCQDRVTDVTNISNSIPLANDFGGYRKRECEVSDGEADIYSGN